MVNGWWLVVAGIAGALTAWSLDVAGVYNPIDKLVDLFRSAESKAKALEAKAAKIRAAL
jgi:hypothetical protein